MNYYDDFKDPRFRSAVLIGRHADAVFREECRKRGLNPEVAGISPIDAIANSPVQVILPMDKEQILNLWNEGLNRPEILALGATVDDFVAAIRTARAIGDPRAYYRAGKSRLPWRIEGPKDKRAKGRMAPVATEMTADAFSPSGTRRRQAMKKDQPPTTPKPKRTTGDMGPTFVGQFVDDLTATFAQIDVAKKELDKRFVPGSDVLWTEVNRIIDNNKS